MADKLTAIRLKQGDGYGPQIPIKADAENIIYKKHYNIEEILGNVDIEKGDLQKQINDVNNTIVDTTQEWLDEHYISPTVSFEVYDPTKAYQQNDYVIYKENNNQNLYICISNTPQPAGDWDSTKWQLIDLTIQIPTAVEVPIDDTLSLSDYAADAKATGDLIKINQTAANTTKLVFNTSSNIVNIPTMDDIIKHPMKNGQYDDGEQGQLLRTNGDGTTSWVDEGLPTDEQVQTVVNEWMNQHSGQYVIPDGNITKNKLSDELKLETIKDYVTPEMFGAKGDGTTDDSIAIQNAISTSDKFVLFTAPTYMVTQPLNIPNNKKLISFVKSNIKTYVNDVLLISDNYNNNSYTLEGVYIFGIYFRNMCQQDSTTHIQEGTFAQNLRGCKIENCFIQNYNKIFGSLSGVTEIINNSFSGIYNRFAASCVDSLIDGNYISASRYGIENSIVFSTDTNSTTFSNNFVDFFNTCFNTGKSGTGFSVIGNRFDRCISCFHDNAINVSASNNQFSNFRYKASEWSVLSSAQLSYLENEKWCIFKFDNAVSTTTFINRVTFTNNVLRDCQYYIYVSNVSITPVYDVYMRDNIAIQRGSIPGVTNNEYAIADAGFTNHQNTSTAYGNKTMTSVYFDFWDMKEYETLPNPAWINGTTRSVKTFKGMRAIYNGHVYVNYNQEWVRADYTENDIRAIMNTT